MKRDKRKNTTELSVFIRFGEDRKYEIIDPSTDGEGIPAMLFTSIINALVKAVDSFNDKRKKENKDAVICQFDSFQQWVNKAQSWLYGYKIKDIIALDTKGRECTSGKDMQLARDENAFPVTVYEVLKSKK